MSCCMHIISLWSTEQPYFHRLSGSQELGYLTFQSRNCLAYFELILNPTLSVLRPPSFLIFAAETIRQVEIPEELKKLSFYILMTVQPSCALASCFASACQQLSYHQLLPLTRALILVNPPMCIEVFQQHSVIWINSQLNSYSGLKLEMAGLGYLKECYNYKPTKQELSNWLQVKCASCNSL